MKKKQQHRTSAPQKKKSRNKTTYTEPRIAKKKQFGQHFLRKQSVVDNMISGVTVDSQTTVMEIGCGDGFLTRSILNQTTCRSLEIFEIDKEWADYVERTISDERMNMNLCNVLDVDLATLQKNQPLVLLANLPYQITFPLFYKFVENYTLFSEAVVMIQEEVAQKIVARRGRGYSAASLYLQHSFDFKLMEKIEPGAFAPPPKVFSRLLYFKPKKERVSIPDEKRFWGFVRNCFAAPRQTLRNNLKRTHHKLEHFDDDLLRLRAQQISFDGFLKVWDALRKQNT